MKSPIKKPTRLASFVIGALAIAACTTTGPRDTKSTPPWPLANFCAEAQRMIGSTSLQANNVLHTDFDAFVLSKPKIRPLETEQFHWYADTAKAQLKMISCKMKTKDHLRSEYGAAEVGEEGLCATINEHSLRVAVAAARRAGARQLRFDGGRHIVFDAEELTNIGPEWLKPHEIAWEDAEGALHVQSRAMRNDWLDPRYLGAPVLVRGTRYCHLIAPEYLERLLTGVASAPRARGAAVSPAQMPAIPPPTN